MEPLIADQLIMRFSPWGLGVARSSSRIHSSKPRNPSVQPQFRNFVLELPTIEGHVACLSSKSTASTTVSIASARGASVSLPIASACLAFPCRTAPTEQNSTHLQGRKRPASPVFCGNTSIYFPPYFVSFIACPKLAATEKSSGESLPVSTRLSMLPSLLTLTSFPPPSHWR